jgi:hypothetical protein
MAYGAMPMWGTWSPVDASCIWWPVAVSLLLMELWWLERQVSGDGLLTVPMNKLEVVAGDDEVGFAVLHVSCNHQGGGGVDQKGDVLISSHPWGLLPHLPETLNGGDLVPLLSSAMVATPRRGPAGSVSSSTSRPAGQKGGLFATPSWCSIVTPSPNGLVPGVGDIGRDVEFLVKLRLRRTQGLDFFLLFCFGVLCVKVQVMVVFYFLFWMLQQFVIPLQAASGIFWSRSMFKEI